jgi:two-component sensor histidine kinase
MMTNSLKYAFLGKETGTITIAMTSDVHSQEYVFIFKDDGIGLPEFFDVLTSKNLGMTFIHSLSQQLDGVYCH